MSYSEIRKSDSEIGLSEIGTMRHLILKAENDKLIYLVDAWLLRVWSSAGIAADGIRWNSFTPCTCYTFSVGHWDKKWSGTQERYFFKRQQLLNWATEWGRHIEAAKKSL